MAQLIAFVLLVGGLLLFVQSWGELRVAAPVARALWLPILGMTAGAILAATGGIWCTYMVFK